MKLSKFMLAGIVATALFTALHAQAEMNTIEGALKHSSRPHADTVRDVARRPADILEFLKVKPGMKVVDYLAGRGYYSEIFTHLLNNQGHLFSVRGRLGERDFSAYKNTTELKDIYLSDLEGPVDRIFTALNYHDIVNKESIDRKQVLKAVYDKLADDGYLVVIDHNARAGAGINDTKSKHRIEGAFVMNEILAAGFKLDSSSTLLANPNDNFALDVWQKSTKGKTDRFVYRFKK